MTRPTLLSTIGTSCDRKVSVAISMPQRLVEAIDSVRGDIPRSVFVCKILYGRIKSDKGGEKDQEDYDR